MKVIVAGAGALGSLLGGYLANVGEDVLLAGREAHVAAIRQNGLRISGLPGDIVIAVEATTELTSRDGPADLIILGAKSQDIEEVLSKIRPVVGDKTQILSPQNGVFTEELVVRTYGAARNLAAVTTINVSTVGPGHFFYGAEGPIELGPQGNQDAATVQPIVDAFNHAGILAKQRQDVMQLKWRKLAVYCVGSIINALTGIQRLAEGDDICELMWDIAEEMIASVEAAKVTPFPIRPLVEEAVHHFEIWRPADYWLASVGQDLQRGKQRTEIDYLNGYIVNLGRQYGVRTPVNHCIYTLVKAIGTTGYFKQRKETLQA